MQPLFFGPPAEQLLGVYHPAEGVPRRECVLLCPPGPEEYMQCHWAFRRLAALLSRSGFDVMRFDYYGTGDSAGETGAGTIRRWEDDVRLAARELLALSGATSLCGVGLRLGAALLALASRTLSLEQAVLWEPPVSGSAYLTELRARDAWLREKRLLAPAAGELLGYPFSAELEEGIAGMGLALSCCGARRLLIVTSEERPALSGMQQRLRQSGANVEHKVLADAPISILSEGALLSSRVLQVIASELQGPRA